MLEFGTCIEYAAVGTWKNEFKSYGQVKTWKITYHYIAKHLVDDRQVEIAQFVKK